MNYNLMPLKYFIDIVQTGGFISAAKRNFVSETAVSSAIGKLEKELGYKLFDRSSNHLVITSEGKKLYKSALEILFSYDEIWHQKGKTEDTLKIHFLEGMQADAIRFGNILSKKYTKYNLSFDQENLSSSVRRLLNKNYDILISFKYAFTGNAKVEFIPFRKINFDLVFNKNELRTYDNNYQKLTANSILYLQYWHTSDMADIQNKMLVDYQKEKNWSYKLTIGVNSFNAAIININFNGGFTMIPQTLTLPNDCHNLIRFTPDHLKNAFEIGAGITKDNSELSDLIHHTIS